VTDGDHTEIQVPVRLVLVEGPCEPREIAVPPEGLLIGRGEGVDISLTEDLAVSHKHARITRATDGMFYMEDLGSANGTFLNGGAITVPRRVALDDVIGIGRTSFELQRASWPSEQSGAVRPASLIDATKDCEGSIGDARIERAKDIPQPGYDADAPGAAASAPGQHNLDDEARSMTWWPTDTARVNASREVHDPALAPQGDGGRPRTGVASNVRQRSEQVTRGEKDVTTQVITFRLAQFDVHGNRAGVVTVELRGRELTGEIADGDRVAVQGRERSGIISATAVRNLTTGGTLQPVRKSNRRRLIRALVIAIVLIVLALLAVHFVPRLHLPGSQNGGSSFVNPGSGGGGGSGGGDGSSGGSGGRVSGTPGGGGSGGGQVVGIYVTRRTARMVT
jgi:hypothetical protein